jgi:hypothetical protein
MIDFIHCHYHHFTGGIFWINCRTPQLKGQSLKYIKDALRLNELSDLPNRDSQPSLVVLDTPNQNPLDDKNDEFQRFLTRANTHIVVVMNHSDLGSLQKVIKYQLNRGSAPLEVHSLSTVHARMRIVHSIMKTWPIDQAPTEQHRVFISECAGGDPNVINVLCAFVEADPLTNVTRYTKEQILQDTFARLDPNEVLLLNILSKMGSASTDFVKQFIKSTKYPDQSTSEIFDTLKAMKLLLPVPKPIVYHPACGGIEEQSAEAEAGGDHFYVPSFTYRYI